MTEIPTKWKKERKGLGWLKNLQGKPRNIKSRMNILFGHRICFYGRQETYKLEPNPYINWVEHLNLN